MGLRDHILKAQDRKTESVDVPEWRCTVGVRTLGGEERDAWEQWLVDNQEGRRNIRARYCALVMVGEDGKRLFSDSDEDIAALGEKSAAALDRVFAAGLRLNAMSADDQEAIEGN